MNRGLTNWVFPVILLLMLNFKCIIFDCDGVLVDSESISAAVFLEMAMELGIDLDFETAVDRFSGTSMKENLLFIEEYLEGKLPDRFEQEFRRRTYHRFEKELQPVDGIHELLDKVTVPYCVASSGPTEKIVRNLTTTNLIHRFSDRIFSCYEIRSWKPEPGIYLHAAEKMGYSPGECIVIEDSHTGIRAAQAGGFRVFALTNEKKKEEFERLGATVIFTLNELITLLGFQ
jgi:HAD superfamily hydrolase (TIGR01509 family)